VSLAVLSIKGNCRKIAINVSVRSDVRRRNKFPFPEGKKEVFFLLEAGVGHTLNGFLRNWKMEKVPNNE
jgi:hypothetical protein